VHTSEAASRFFRSQTFTPLALGFGGQRTSFLCSAHLKAKADWALSSFTTLSQSACLKYDEITLSLPSKSRRPSLYQIN